jgi:hypothetical protein
MAIKPDKGKKTAGKTISESDKKAAQKSSKNRRVRE